MSKCDHEHKVCETHLRTLLKGITGKGIEVMIDIAILDQLIMNFYINSITANPEINSVKLVAILSMGALMIEGICFGIGYLNERLWNRIQWGRKVVEITKT